MTRPRTDSPATDFAVALLEELISAGVRDVVLSPGSRSQALALTVAELERLGLVRLRVRIDERVAGFLALGLAVETRLPVVIITTSGTAVANLHPAVLEAHHSGVPIIVISADRPDRLRGIGANQTTQQPGIFGPAVRREWDVPAPSGAPGEEDAAAQLARDAFVIASEAPGPVHLNLAFDEPLSAPTRLSAASVTASAHASPPAVAAVSSTATGIATGIARDTATDTATRLAIEPGTIVIAGTGAGASAEQVARDLGAPLVAEVASGAHFGPNLVVAYRPLLGDPQFGGRVRRVIVFGHPTLSREVPAIIQRPDVHTIVVRGDSPEDYSPGRRVEVFVDHVVVEKTIPLDKALMRAWVGGWVSASRAVLEQSEAHLDDDATTTAAPTPAARARQALAAVRAPIDRRILAESVWRATWPHDRLVLAASRLIREVDSTAPGKRIRVHANRGLAGIDGTIATGLGIALASQASGADGKPGASGTTRVLLGDLAFLHDAGALLLAPGEVRPRIQLIVGNDGGGTIFDGLEVARSAGTGFDRVLLTPQNAPIEQLALAYGWAYLRADTQGALDQSLTAAVGPTIVEVVLER